MSVRRILSLTYIFHADSPEVVPVGLEDWFRFFPTQQGSLPDSDSSVAASEDLKSYVDNTYFFSRSCREYLFPEIVTIEDEVLQSAPSTFRESHLYASVESTADLAESIAERWMQVRRAHVVPESRRLRRYLVSRIAGVDRGPQGWTISGSVKGGWERTVESVHMILLDAEVQMYAGNVGVVVLTIGTDEESLSDVKHLADIAAVTKDVLPPNSLLPVADLRVDGGTSDECTWLMIVEEITRPFRLGDTPNARSLFTPKNQEFGQYFRRLWYLCGCDMDTAYSIVRTNYLQPFEPKDSPSDIVVDRKAPDRRIRIDEGWVGLVHHHEFVISRDLDSKQIETTEWWYRDVFEPVVFLDYSWLWLLTIVQRVRLGRLLASLDVSAPSDAEAELQEFYDFMQQENFAIPSTQPVGNLLAAELNEASGVDDLIELIEREAEVIRESVLQRSSRVQQAALVVIALLGTWLALGELANPEGEFDLNWFGQRNVWLALPIIVALYWLCRSFLLRRRRLHSRRR